MHFLHFQRQSSTKDWWIRFTDVIQDLGKLLLALFYIIQMLFKFLYVGIVQDNKTFANLILEIGIFHLFTFLHEVVFIPSAQH